MSSAVTSRRRRVPKVSGQRVNLHERQRSRVTATELAAGRAAVCSVLRGLPGVCGSMQGHISSTTEGRARPVNVDGRGLPGRMVVGTEGGGRMTDGGALKSGFIDDYDLRMEESGRPLYE